MKILDSLLLAVLTSTAAWAQNAPSIYDGSTPVTSVAHTAYSGEQTITCVKLKDGTYALYDPTRNVYTVDASFAKLIKNGIADITAENAHQTDILYNTLGQRISSTQHAVFIKNGKKFVK